MYPLKRPRAVISVTFNQMLILNVKMYQELMIANGTCHFTLLCYPEKETYNQSIETEPLPHYYYN